MKNLKKIMAVAIAVVMMAALSVAIFADAIGTGGTVESTATSVTFKNVLNAWNPDDHRLLVDYGRNSHRRCCRRREQQEYHR